MAIKFQYNKTSMQRLEKELKIRVNALPTLKNKEAALRVEVKRAKEEAEKLDKELKDKTQEYQYMNKLWDEFDPDLIRVKNVDLGTKKIAGVETPVFKDATFEVQEFSIYNRPHWFLDGLDIVKELTKLALEREVYFRKMNMLDYARKKTTQKVNLYEKVQIPDYQDAIRKIKRFLEDEENLSKAAQKIVKNRQQKAEETQ
ncbi:MAG: V-type ATP synthase subunit D [Bacteroidales bacterium]|nr:V-type ATP synthase subunit D [Bacteroidales bacterium]MCF8327906.1 V-type ATP synthase subunit D [Bacteroidales bacterium]